MPRIEGLRFKGVGRLGFPTVGATTMRPGAFVKQCYDRRYQSLTVTRDGVEVGAIAKDPATGRRTWWGEA